MSIQVVDIIRSFKDALEFNGEFDDESLAALNSLCEAKAREPDELFDPLATYTSKHQPENPADNDVFPVLSTDPLNPYFQYAETGSYDESNHGDNVFLMVFSASFTHDAKEYFGTFLYNELQAEYGEIQSIGLDVRIAESNPKDVRALLKETLIQAIDAASTSYCLLNSCLDMLTKLPEINTHILLCTVHGIALDAIVTRVGVKNLMSDYLRYERNDNGTPGDANILFVNNKALFHNQRDNSFKSVPFTALPQIHQTLTVRPDLNGKPLDDWLAALNPDADSKHIPPRYHLEALKAFAADFEQSNGYPLPEHVQKMIFDPFYCEAHTDVFGVFTLVADADNEPNSRDDYHKNNTNNGRIALNFNSDPILAIDVSKSFEPGGDGDGVTAFCYAKMFHHDGYAYFISIQSTWTYGAFNGDCFDTGTSATLIENPSPQQLRSCLRDQLLAVIHEMDHANYVLADIFNQATKAAIFTQQDIQSIAQIEAFREFRVAENPAPIQEMQPYLNATCDILSNQYSTRIIKQNNPQEQVAIKGELHQNLRYAMQSAGLIKSGQDMVRMSVDEVFERVNAGDIRLPASQSKPHPPITPKP